MRLFPATSNNLIDFGVVPAGKFITAAGIYVSSVVGMQAGDKIQIMLDSGVLFTTTLTAINNTTPPNIRITPALPSRASAGNIVMDLTQSTIVAPVNLDNV